MAIELSIPLSHSSYQRTFAAEIDVLADNELLVRGSMRDHRFAFEHIWRLRTPEYEIIEAAARQTEGEFDQRLCERYAGVKGARVGRGFSKRVLSALGDSPGAQEHLLTAIEMARVGQQVYQYTPEFEAQFPSSGSDATETARITWLKDRAYMGLANTCYTYRDESEGLFASDWLLNRRRAETARRFTLAIARWKTASMTSGSVSTCRATAWSRTPGAAERDFLITASVKTRNCEHRH
jgi:hypothetical protein